MLNFLLSDRGGSHILGMWCSTTKPNAPFVDLLTKNLILIYNPPPPTYHPAQIRKE